MHIKKHLITRIVELIPLTSSDLSRNIFGVFVHSDKERVTLVATDGRMLLTETLDTFFPAGTYLVSRFSAEALQAIIESSDGDDISYEKESDVTIGDRIRVRFEAVTDHPDFPSVIPQKKDGMARIAFNTSYMEALGKALAPHSSVVWIEFDPENPLGGIRVNATNEPNRLGVLMPCRFTAH